MIRWQADAADQGLLRAFVGSPSASIGRQGATSQTILRPNTASNHELRHAGDRLAADTLFHPIRRSRSVGVLLCLLCLFSGQGRKSSRYYVASSCKRQDSHCSVVMMARARKLAGWLLVQYSMLAGWQAGAAKPKPLRDEG